MTHKPPLEESILLFLEKEYSEYYALLNELLKQLYPEENDQVYRHVIESLRFLTYKNYALSLNTNFENLGQPVTENNERVIFDFSLYSKVKSAQILLKITPIGLEYIRDIRREQKLDELQMRQTESIEQSNQQNILVGKSVVETNNKTQDNFNSQKNLAKWSLILAGFSTLFIVITVVLQYRDKTSEEVRGIKEQLQIQSKTLEKLESSIQAANSFIQQIKTDTFLVKKHR